MLISKYGNRSISQVEEFENKFGIKLNESYRSFLIKYNGGETPDTNWNGKCRSNIRFFYGIDLQNECDILKALESEIAQNLLEKKYLPIAENSFGDCFCINLEDEKIYFSYHDREQIILIAESFAEFVSKIKSKKIGHIRTIEERTQLLLEKRGRKPTEVQLKGWQEEIDIYSKIHQEEVIL